MRILIVSYTYWPDVQPRSIRWQSLANYWANIGHDVSVITATLSDKNNETKDNGVKIIRIPENWIGRIRKKLSQSTSENRKIKTNDKKPQTGKHRGTKKKSITAKLKKVIKVVYELSLKKLHWPDYAWSWIINARKATLAHLDSNDSYDVVISVSHPFSSHLVGRAVKRRFPELKWIIDMGDPFCFLVQSPPNNFLLYSRLNKKIERSCFDESDGMVVTTAETKNEYARLFSEIVDKVRVIPPLLSTEVSLFLKTNQQKRDQQNNLLKLVFVGTLYSEIRHPGGLLRLLDAASQDVDKKIEIHFVGPVNDIDTSLFSFPNISIYFQGNVNREVALRYMLDSDVLVSIGNSTKFQLPSKLVEYASTGKPILNISSIENDSSSRFLSSYPASKTICIKNCLTNEMIEELANFLNTVLPIDLDYNDSWLEKHETPNIAREYEDLFS